MQKDIYTQVATYWSSPTLDGYGDRQFAVPILINCRWENRTGLQIQVQDEIINSKAVVYPDQQVEIGGYLFLGDATATADPQTLSDAYLIQDFKAIPSVSGREILRKAIL